MERRKIVQFHELSEEWQSEAISNLGDDATNEQYLEPKQDKVPEKHILWDLSEAMSTEGSHKGFEYNATIGISNNSCMLLNIDDAFETADIIFA